MADAAARTARSPWPVAAVLVSGTALGLAALLWLTTPQHVTVAVTPIELAITLSSLGAFVLSRRPDHRVAALVAATGVAFALVALAAATLTHAAGVTGTPPAITQTALAVGWLGSGLPVPWLLLMLWFPDGTFAGGRWGRVFIAIAAAAAGLAVVGYLFGPPGRLPSMLAGIHVAPDVAGPFSAPGRAGLLSAAGALVLLPLLGVPSLIARYRGTDALVRQQIRWLVSAAAATIVLTVLGIALSTGPAEPAAAGSVLSTIAQPLPAAAITVALLRYRLWEIDVVISRAVVYTLLWALLSVLLLVPAFLSGYLVGGPGTIAAVASALLVTLAFQPVRRRLQAIVDDKVYGARRRGRLRLARAGDTLRAIGDIDTVAPRLAEIVQEALDVEWATVLLHLRSDSGAGRLRPVGAVGAQPLPTRMPGDTAAELLANPEPHTRDTMPDAVAQLLPQAALVVPLAVADELVGVIACGVRRGQRFDEGDLEALHRFAGECALGLRGLRLDAELRQRVAEIEQQATELRSSRQRLARAQDDERRRIERNLHDGAQQQLVRLATRIRRLTLSTSGEVRAEWDAIASEAEDAVFALQDLARGIFPAVLVDQGLAVALHTQTARSVLPVRVEIAPSISGRRFDAETEAALYFVALEALTNITKHASDASASLNLHLSDTGREIVLEVHDDGPGLPTTRRTAGVGLVNMHDRIAAAGGTLTVDSRPGAGTWIRAVAPLGSDVIPLHPVEVDSRR